MHELTDEALLGLVTEETGQAHDSNPVKMVCASIKHLKKFADFSQVLDAAPLGQAAVPIQDAPIRPPAEPPLSPQSFGLNLGYTINLNLPATSDPEVFNAIFKSLKEHLLRSSDA